MDAEERKAELMKDNKMDGFMFKLDYDPVSSGARRLAKTESQKVSAILSAGLRLTNFLSSGMC